MDAAIWGLFGTIVGALASIATTWLSVLSSYKIQKEKDQFERVERARLFQRETLVDLQEAIHDALRLISRAHMEDLKANHGSNSWGTNLLPKELSEELRLAQRRVSLLVERVSDDELRHQVKTLMKNATAVLWAKSPLESQAHLEMMTFESTPVFESIGTVLRRHY